MIPHQEPINQRILLPDANEQGIEIWVKRLDLVHPTVSGNKFYKLKYNLEFAQQHHFKSVLSFGGAYSNHIYALAAASSVLGMQSIGIIRGEASSALNPTLTFAKSRGMKLEFISREQYRDKYDPDFLSLLRSWYGDYYLVPEGGTNALAIQGTQEILRSEDAFADMIICSAGTGGTAAGLISSADSRAKVLVFSALKGDFLKGEIENLLPSAYSNWQLNTDFHFGGYAKVNKDLLQFIRTIEVQHQLPLEPIYTAKAFYGMLQLIKNQQIAAGSKLLFIHTGGLQGRAGYGW